METLSTVIEFVSSGTGGGGSEDVVATTYDPLFATITVLAALIAIAALVFAYVRFLNHSQCTTRDTSVLHAKSFGYDNQNTLMKILGNLKSKVYVFLIISICAIMAAATLVITAQNKAMALDSLHYPQSNVQANSQLNSNSNIASISDKVIAHVDDSGNVTIDKGLIKNNDEILKIGVRQVKSESSVDLSDATLIITCADQILFNRKVGEVQLNEDYVTVPVGKSSDLCYQIQMSPEKAKGLVGSSPVTLSTYVDLVCTKSGQILAADGKTPVEGSNISYSFQDPYNPESTNSNEKVIKEATTDVDGKYTIPDIQKGLTVSCDATYWIGTREFESKYEVAFNDESAIDPVTPKANAAATDFNFVAPGGSQETVYDAASKKASVTPTDIIKPIIGEGTQTVEYCLDGSQQWTETAPVDAGKYHVRAVIKDWTGFNDGPVESDEWWFTIIPLDVSEGFEVGTFDPMTYTGTPQTPNASVTKTLEGKTFSATGVWSDVINVADTTSFTANGNFSGVIKNQSTGMQKADSSVVNCPAAITGLVYTGSDIALADAGKCIGGTLRYIISGTKPSKETSGWLEEVPKAKDAGDYNLWYYVKGDANYNDVEVCDSPIICKIAKATPTLQLNESATYTVPTEAEIDTGYNGDGELKAYSSDASKAIVSVEDTKIIVTPVSPTSDNITIHVYGSVGTNYKAISKKQSATILAGTIEYTKTPATGLVYNNTEQILGNVNVSLPSECTITYYVDGKQKDIPTAKNAGNHTVDFTITKKGYATINDSFQATIAKAESTVTKVPEAIALSYCGEAQTLATEGECSGGTMQYIVSDTKPVKGEDSWSENVPTATNAGEYKLWYYVQGDDNHNDVEVCQNPIICAISKATPILNINESVKYTVDTEVEFDTDYDGDGQLSASSSDDTKATVSVKDTTVKVSLISTTTSPITITVSATAGTNYEAISKTQSVTIVEEPTIVYKKAPTIGLVYNGEELTLGKVTVSIPAPGQYSIMYIVDDVVKDKPTATEPGEHKVNFVITADGYEPVNDSFTSAIAKAKPSVTTTPKANSLTYTGESQTFAAEGECTGGTLKYMISDTKPGKEASGWSDSVPAGIDAGDYKLWYYVKGDSNHYDSAVCKAPVVCTIVKANPAIIDYPEAKSGLKYCYEEQELAVAGNCSGGDFYYIISDIKPSSSTLGWSKNVPTGIDAGDYKLWYCILGDKNHNDVDVCESAIVCSIAKIDPSVYEQPKSIADLVYNNSEQTLAEPGVWSGGGTMKYMISDTKPEKTSSEWSADVQKRINAGDYNLWYYITGDKNHNEKDVCDMPIVCSIARATSNLEIDESAIYTIPNESVIDVKYNGDGVLKAYSSDTSKATVSVIDNAKIKVTPLLPTQSNITIFVYATAGNNYKAISKNQSAEILPGIINYEIMPATGLVYNDNEQILGSVVVSLPSGCAITYKVDGKAKDEPKAKDAGKHTVEFAITKKGYTTIYDSFDTTIAKADCSLTVIPEAKDLTYSGDGQTLATSGVSIGGTLQYLISDTKPDKGSGDWSETVPEASNAGDYKLWYYVKGDSNYNDVDVCKNPVLCSIAKATPTLNLNESATYTVETEVEIETSYDGDGQLNAVSSEGSKATVSVEGTTVIVSLISTTTTPIDIMVIANEGTNYKEISKTQSVTIIEKPTINYKKSPTIGLVYNGDELTLGKVAVSYPGEYTIKYKVNGEEKPEPKATDAGSYEVSFTILAEGLDTVEDSFTSAIVKAKSSVTKAPQPNALTYSGSPQALATPGEFSGGTMKYMINNTKPDKEASGWLDSVPAGTLAGDYKLWYYVKGSDNYYDVEVCKEPVVCSIGKSNPVIEAEPKAKSGLVYSSSELVLAEAGECTGGVYYYCVSDVKPDKQTGNWSEIVPSAEDAGNYKLWYFILGDKNHNDVDVCASAIECLIAKADPVIHKEPTAISNLEYNKNEQTLAEPGIWSGGGTMKYMISDTKPSKVSSEWSEEIPTRINAGQYNLWYYITGNDNYNEKDVCNTAIACTIAKITQGVSVNIDPMSGRCSVMETQDFTAVPLDFPEETPIVSAVSESEQIATVSEKSSTETSKTFAVTGVAIGETKINVIAESTNYAASIQYSATILGAKVIKQVTNISFKNANFVPVFPDDNKTYLKDNGVKYYTDSSCTTEETSINALIETGCTMNELYQKILIDPTAESKQCKNLWAKAYPGVQFYGLVNEKWENVFNRGEPSSTSTSYRIPSPFSNNYLNDKKGWGTIYFTGSMYAPSVSPDENWTTTKNKHPKIKGVLFSNKNKTIDTFYGAYGTCEGGVFGSKSYNVCSSEAGGGDWDCNYWSVGYDGWVSDTASSEQASVIIQLTF